MYKLENNVEWTTQLKNAFKKNVTRCKIIYGIDEYNENNFLKDAELQDVRYVPDVGFIGQAVSRMLTVTLVNDLNSNINLENKEIIFKLGADYNNQTYYINYGNFIVNEPPENDDTNGTVKLVAYDYMIKFNKPYVNTIEYPCTLYELLQNVCYQAGVELGSLSFANDSFQVVNNQFAGKTLREVLQHIAKCAFSWARIGQDNKLYLDFEVNNVIDETIGVDDYKMDSFKKANEYYGAINKVTYADSDITGHEESVQDNADIALHGIKELIIYDNYFAYSTPKRQELIQAGTRLFGLTYIPVQQMDMIGLAYLDCNDILGIEDSEGTVFTTRNFSHIIKYNGALSDSITSEATSKIEETYNNQNSPISANLKVERSVDRSIGRIDQMISDITEQNNKISQITQTVDSLNARIQDIADITTYGESDSAIVSLQGINQSEPIMIKVHPVSTNISYLYPRSNLYPSDTQYLPNRIIRFIRTYEEEGQTLTENIDYELPDDLLKYSSTVYDEFYLDYDSQTCQVIKRCAYNADGTVRALANEVTTNYPYPQILLNDGDYEIQLLGYESGYLYVRLMAQNIYTSQFATRAEMRSEINQTAESINLEVSQKIGEDEVVSSINQSAEKIELRSNRLVIQSDNFQLTEEGRITATEGVIGGFGLGTKNFTGNLSGIYNYNEYDLRAVMCMAMEYLGENNILNDVLDANNSGRIDSADFVRIRRILLGQETNIKNVNGTFIIDSTDPKNCIQVTKGGETAVSIGVGGINSILATVENFLCGNASTSGFTGIAMNGDTGTLSVLDDNHRTVAIEANGNITCVSLTQTSLETEKKNFEKFENALDVIKNIDIYKYNLKNEKDNDKKHIGFVIGNDFNYRKEVTSKENDGVDIYSFVSTCCQAIKEQQEQIEQMKKEIEELKRRYK